MRSTIIRRVVAVTNLPPRVPERIKFAEAVQSRLRNNPHFPLPDPVLTAFDVALAGFSGAATAAQTGAKGTIEARNAEQVVFIGAIYAVMARVQQVADANPEQAEAIITGAGFSVRKAASRQRQQFAVKYGETSGAVLVTAPVAAPRASYEWQYSLDGGKTWIQVPNTIQARTKIFGLPVATVVEFRYRVTTKAGMGDWSQSISILVK